MKIIKRDGRVVEYNREKIFIAISKANNDVSEHARANKKQIDTIIKHIEELNKKRMLVEDVQDIIETELMRIKKFELAKAYIIYRYNRALVRKSNTTDESIMNLIKNSNKNSVEDNYNKNAFVASVQRNLIAGEVSKDLTKRVLLPEKISLAHNEGILHFHNADYFLQPIFNSCLINYEDMLTNKTVINNYLIETPKSFQVACTVLTQIIASVAASQYGGQSINIEYLGKYLKISEDKFRKRITDKYKDTIKKNDIEELVKDRLQEELTGGIQTIQYQINTLMTNNQESSTVTLFLYLNENDPYIDYTAKIIEEIIQKRNVGIKDESGIYTSPNFPKLIYVLDENNNLTGGKYDYITRIALDCTRNCLSPSYISAKKMREVYENNVFSPMGYCNFLSCYKEEANKYKFDGRFSQGIVSINLPQIAIIADKNENDFWTLLDERLELCYEALMCRHYALLGTSSNVSPIHWQYGSIARLNKNEKVDKYLKNGYSTLSLGYIGIYETTKLMKGVSHTEPDGEKFALKLMKYMKTKCNEWKKNTGLSFTLYGTPGKNISYRFAKIDKDKYGDIKDITDKKYYTNAYHVDYREEMDTYLKIQFESQFQSLSTGGSISYVKIPDDTNNNLDYMEKIIKFIYDNIQYVEFTNDNNYCQICGSTIQSKIACSNCCNKD